jgi:hypothetical protein
MIELEYETEIQLKTLGQMQDRVKAGEKFVSL